ncbi:hypothetical protein COLO4_20641 [Corchorus olitorius]|uniref:Uncharacterized protein n=1 Tax=Corchorus olitorius TaxID=93759 RepID=A0A1R3IYA2_9ROSI|nr:hypothetical protein COLO4_20641 [Corchorus olitorius]
MKPLTLLKSFQPSLHLSFQISKSDRRINRIFGYVLPLHLATETPKPIHDVMLPSTSLQDLR